ncbi:MAG: putative metal-dependent hydrolase [bacterium]|nr:putative metal-dependent hydrolase [bacterium]
MQTENLRYPIGHFVAPAHYATDDITNYVSTIEAFPAKLRKTVASLSESQLDTVYRPGGWTVRQVVNHCADSHMNAFIRHKLAVTSHEPTINPYPEALWAELADGKSLPIEASIKILEGLHLRWAVLLKSLQQEQWQRSFYHPEKGRKISLEESAGSYAWHCNHHLAHITELKKRMNWL